MWLVPQQALNKFNGHVIRLDRNKINLFKHLALPWHVHAHSYICTYMYVYTCLGGCACVNVGTACTCVCCSISSDTSHNNYFKPSEFIEDSYSITLFTPKTIQ